MSYSTSKSLVLASASPRRFELLSLFGIPFKVIPPLGEETAEGSGRDLVMSLAQAKCSEVFAQVPDQFVLAADTLVCIDGITLGKPKSENDAADMLTRLSGHWHEVHTGMCLQGPNGYFRLVAETTAVEFAALPPELILRYVQTGEPMDKAGAYAIQGISGMFISRIEGSPSNVMGLPLDSVRRLLLEAGFPLLGENIH